MSRINDMLLKFGSIGRNEDRSITRPGNSEAYWQALQAVREEMGRLGLETDVDPVGNLHGYLPGSVPEKKSIVMGSHLDTVINGGLFDGMLGVVGAMEVVARLRERGITLQHPLEVFGFNFEEGGPLGGTFGSRCVSGMLSPETPGLAEKLRACGMKPADVAASRRDISRYACYLEYHIEQGDYLDMNQLDIGVVSGIVGIVRYTVTAVGMSNHAGTTMMSGRRDALVAMSRLIVAADQKARELSDTLVFTVGKISVSPGQENVIPGECTATFEFRHMEKDVTDAFFEAIRKIASEISGCTFHFVNTARKYATVCDPVLMEAVSSSAEELGARHVVMPSGAGHDAAALAHEGVSIGMIFVPSVAGISHHGKEMTEERHVELGADVLFETVRKLDRMITD